ncbi:MAG: amidohydrolase family protein [Verrucomicrobia bacterium]|nr:amidohydrolase family protein [Verrucomicrobiota bacterium]
MRRQADQWRADHRIIDLHLHIDSTPEHLARAVRILDSVGVGIGINLSGGYVTHAPGQKSEFERNKELADRLFPGRFLYYMNLDYSGWDNPDFSERAVKQIEEGHRLGAAGFKEFKRLGLYLRDKAGRLIKIDDPKLDPVWEKCGELGMPISIHVADPKAFWQPLNEKNERWKELKDHPSWWFGDPNKYPSDDALREALNRVIARHPKTTFVCVHFANNAEDIDWVDRMLDRYPNMMADLAARIPELGRHDPLKVHELFVKHQDRILFATDFQVYDELTLGSGGSGPPPTDADAATFYAKEWRWLETDDRQFEHMTPIQGDWKIDAIGLPAPVLRKIYFDNTRKLLARSMPAPILTARHLDADFASDGDLTKAGWQRAEPVHMEYESLDYTAHPAVSTTVRVLWSDKFLYLGYECPFTELTVFTPPKLNEERLGLWDRDVVEAFIGSDLANIKHYAEFELAPTNEKLDLTLNLPDKDFQWSSGFETGVKLDRRKHVWTATMRIPLTALSAAPPEAGARWRIDLYRCDKANHAFLAWSPTLTETFHTPEKFGVLEFAQ